MLGFLFGTMCLGMLAVLFKPGCHRGFHGHHGHHGHRGMEGVFGRGGGRCGPGEGRRGRGPGRGRRWGGGLSRAAGEVFKRKLDIDEDQEDLVDHALRDLTEAFGGFSRELKRERADLAEAFAGDEVDEAGLAALWAQQDEELQRLRREAVSALKQIHAVLDPEQRTVAAGWMKDGGMDQGRWA